MKKCKMDKRQQDTRAIPPGPDAILLSVRLRNGGFESQVEVPVESTKEEIDEFVLSWLALMQAGIKLGQDRRNRAQEVKKEPEIIPEPEPIPADQSSLPQQ
jgi:hypothetical protein